MSEIKGESRGKSLTRNIVYYSSKCLKKNMKSATSAISYGSIQSHEEDEENNIMDDTTDLGTTSPDSGMERFDDSKYLSPFVHSNDIQTASDTDCSFYNTSTEDFVNDGDEERAILMATVLVEDAIEHRSIQHKLDINSLLKYRLYHSKPVRVILRINIAVLLSLAFIEKPSSLTSTSDPSQRGERPELPCGVTESIEFICLLILSADFMFRSILVGKRQMKQSNWLLALSVFLIVSYLDWFVSLGYVCQERWRIRRILRPFFLIQNSSLMKKTVQSIQQSMPQILSVLFLMFLQIYFFTMLGMILFSPQNMNVTTIPIDVRDDINDKNEGIAYFEDVGAAVISLVVLLTTANNPDVMMPAYSDNRFYSLYFILFIAIGLYFFMNVLLAVIYNQFKGSFTKSMQVSFMRRRLGVRAAYEVLRGYCPQDQDETYSRCVMVTDVQKVLREVRFSKKSRYMPDMNQYLKRIVTPDMSGKQFQDFFDIVFQDTVKKRFPCRHFNNRVLRRIQSVLLHDYFQYFGDFMSMVNVFVVTVQLASSNRINTFTAHNNLAIFNFCFICYYALEQILMIVFIGPRRYFSHKHVWFESLITWLLVLVEIVCIGLYGGPFPFLSDDEVMERSKRFHILSMFNLLRITNMLIIIRLLRIIPSIKPLKMVASTLYDLVTNMKSFGGILVTIYYIFAVVGIMIFEGKSPQPPPNSTTLGNSNTSVIPANATCGSYEQLNYYANNFDDFAAALVVLFDVMVVNNWQVFLEAFSRTAKSRMYQVYFVLWWLVSVVICINLFVALVIEAFITQWDKQVVVKKKHKKRKYAHNEETSRHFRVHEWFRADYREPTEEEIVQQLLNQPYLRKHILVRPSETTVDS